MSSYSSKSQKRSKSQSKNGGRRRKRTLKNVRRRKSRKVMRGGAAINSWQDLNTKLQSNNDVKTKLISAFGLLENATVEDIFNAVARNYKGTNINTTEVINRDGPIKKDPSLIAFFNQFQ
jgi:hypothetical protein